MNPETEYREGLEELAAHYKDILRLLGEDTEREGLEKTPMRVAKAIQVLTRGYQMDAHKVLTDALFKEDYRQMVIVKDIDFLSLCEHHMLPFYGRCHIGYIPRGKVFGVSKLARLVDCFARRLQIQERLTQEIADYIKAKVNAEGVGVVMECHHLCMMMRGVQKQNSCMVTSAMRGSFLKSVATRSEFLRLIEDHH